MNKIITFILFFSIVSVASVMADSFSYEANERRDPMWPLVSDSGTIISYDGDISYDDLMLEGIMSDAAGYIAIVNGNIVKEGDTVFEEFVVEEVEANKVVIKNDTETFTLILNKEE